MLNSRWLLPGAVVLFVISALIGGYVFSRTHQKSDAGPAVIKAFSIAQGSFLITGDNLSRVELWAVIGGQQKFLGNATLTSHEAGDELWTMMVPTGLKGAAGVFARGYDAQGVAAAKIDLRPSDLTNL